MEIILICHQLIRGIFPHLQSLKNWEKRLMIY